MSDLAATLDAIVAFVRRYVVVTTAQEVAIALWVFHTHAFDASEVTPYLSIVSAEKRSGKTRLLEVLAQVVSRPLRAAGVTSAALFRSIAERTPTVLFDEVDAIFGPKTAATHEDLRALLNAGFQMGTPVLRCVGEGSKQRVEEFAVYCPKALAGIGTLPDTVADRSIVIRLKRRTSGESVERFRRRAAEEQAEPLRISAESLASHYVDQLADARPEIPGELDDRAADGWEPLLAIADLAGGDWPIRARRAALTFSGEQAAEDDSIGVRLLADVRSVFDREDGDRLASETIVHKLHQDAEAPWADWHGKGLTQRSLAAFLRRYGIRSRNVRLADGTVPKGYKREDFEDAWRRYLPETGSPSATSATSAQPSRLEPFCDPLQDPDVADREYGAKPHEQTDVADVADRNDETGRAPLPGDELYPLFLAEKGNAGHITESEFHELLAVHHGVGVTTNGSSELGREGDSDESSVVSVVGRTVVAEFGGSPNRGAKVCRECEAALDRYGRCTGRGCRLFGRRGKQTEANPTIVPFSKEQLDHANEVLDSIHRRRA